MVQSWESPFQSRMDEKEVKEFQKCRYTTNFPFNFYGKNVSSSHCHSFCVLHTVLLFIVTVIS